ncbi:5-methyltetrahydropteroyltriglutamate--homocysteine S-methyltransferase [Holdemanella porci]|uniref:5-methyltetrahydropteroyltriglutamate-- homocysteine S-methyltransferase n=1 Tax=Holdemanella porci TaxID=2652276 RepID=UPI0022E2774E|nr:5-methyltetrahydropteroyltriglutamate--homocysteine S-methyltransferase [Holdemanella porci]
MTVQTPYRYDVVGSFLRPEKLKQARKDYESKKISREELTQIEDECITDLVQKEKAAGLHVITDGEFRRATWHLDFMWGFDGVSHTPTKTGLPFHGEAAMIDDTYITGKVGVSGTHPFVEHFKFLTQFEDENTIAKQTIPAPAQFLEQMILPFALENTKKYYEDTEELVQDIAKGYKVVIQQLYDAGCRCIQFDDCSWGMLVDEKAPLFFQTDQEGLLKVQELFLRINNLAIEGKPEDLTINTHVCRGNFHSTYASSGAYDAVAKILFAKENVHAYFLEFDDARSGGFEPLKEVTPDKKVVLGLVTTKLAKLEDKETVIARIKEASQYVPLENLCLSPQCGFASCEIGNKLTEEQQWAKVKLVKEIAEEVWG